MAYLHARGIVHGRLKTTNVLLNRAGVAKVADAALGSLLSHCKASSGTGGSGNSPGRPGAFTAWMAPEVCPSPPLLLTISSSVRETIRRAADNVRQSLSNGSYGRQSMVWLNKRSRSW